MEAQRKEYPRQESNLHLELRRLSLYPFNYRGIAAGISGFGWAKLVKLTGGKN